MASPNNITIWSPRSPNILNGPIKISTPPSNTTSNNIQTDWTKLSTNSANSAVKNLEYRINDKNVVEFRYPTTPDPNGPKTTANSIQEIADDALYVANYGYTGTTTNLIKDALQRELTTKAEDIKWFPPPPPPPTPDTGGGGDSKKDTEDQQIDYKTVSDDLGQINDVVAKEFGELIYPEKGPKVNGQDYIQFTVFEYLPQGQTENKLLFDEKNQFSGKEKGLGKIYLPIQPTITDTNTVSWGEDKFGILEMMGANLSLGAMSGDSAEELAGKFAETVTSSGNKVDPKIVSAVQTYLAKMAIGSNNNLLSRLTGAVTNPNLTLLFNSPDLRNFNFNFKLTPRTQSEGTIVRKIIRVFKQYMAVQRSSGNLFLEAPCIFKIRYIRGKDRFNKEDDLDHPALNRIKTCALRNFSVNYTPAGSYMTYNDQAGTMSSYDLTMSFTELEPVYWDNYNEIPEDQIGY
jgi:hypothetical protein